ncbi:hypothetical protein D3C86_2241670 [compost metagenome]
MDPDAVGALAAPPAGAANAPADPAAAPAQPAGPSLDDFLSSAPAAEPGPAQPAPAQ